MQAVIDISWWQLGLFLTTLAIPLAINAWLGLKLHREFLIAAGRMVIQLVLVGLYLAYLFELNSVFINGLWLLIMLLIGASAIVSKARLPRRWVYGPVLAGLVCALLPLLALLLFVLLQPTPWFSAQYLIPLAGMLLGNSLSGNIVALQRLNSAFQDKFAEYEAALALGATPKQAAQGFVQQALQQAQAPIIASMATTGLVTLPGMMTGQILGGTDPMIAIKYQLVILVAIAVMLVTSVAITLLLTLACVLGPTGQVKLAIKSAN